MLRTGRIHRSRGFTLIEIIIAVMVLAFSLTTLLGLQSSATDQAIRTRNKQTAMLVAREIMAAIEFEGADIKPGVVRGTPEQLLERYMPEGSRKKEETQKEASSLPLDGEVEVVFWNIEGLPERSVLKVILRLSWSPNPQDEVRIEYFVPARLA